MTIRTSEDNTLHFLFLDSKVCDELRRLDCDPKSICRPWLLGNIFGANPAPCPKPAAHAAGDFHPVVREITLNPLRCDAAGKSLDLRGGIKRGRDTDAPAEDKPNAPAKAAAEKDKQAKAAAAKAAATALAFTNARYSEKRTARLSQRTRGPARNGIHRPRRATGHSITSTAHARRAPR
jgi:hypothetical protein